VGPLVVVVDEPGVDFGLEDLHALVQSATHLGLEEFLQHGTVEALDEAVGAVFLRAWSPVLETPYNTLAVVNLP
jgi:hypothetical protein